MHQSLRDSYQKYNEIREAFIARIAGLSPEQQAFKPSPKEWNHLQVLEHIVSSEGTMLAFFRKYDPALSERKVGLKSKAANLALTQFYRSPKKVRMPTGLPAPTGTISLVDMQAQATDVMAGLTEFIAALPAEKVTYSVFKHPVSGSMNMKNTITFLGNHILHHNHQLDRIAKHSDFPHD